MKTELSAYLTFWNSCPHSERIVPKRLNECRSNECRVYRSNGQWVQTIYQDQPYLTGESDAGTLFIVQCRHNQAEIHFKVIK